MTTPVLETEAQITAWEVNQGKRLIKRLRKICQPGEEYDFLLSAMRTAAVNMVIKRAAVAGESLDNALVLAVCANDLITVPKRSGFVGFDLTQLLMQNGAAPGRIKAALDSVLLAVYNNQPLDQSLFDRTSAIGGRDEPKNEPEFPTHPGFPATFRDNY